MSDSQPHVELIPGTALPMYAPGDTAQTEGRGDVQIRPGRQPVSLLERIAANGDGVSGAELAHIDAAIRAYNKAVELEAMYFPRQADQTDPTTGNLVLPIFDVPQGMQGHLSMLTVDAPQSATINPSAPFSSSGVYAFIAVAPPTSSDDDAVSLRSGLVAFAPTASGGPVLPGQWTFNDSNAPIAWGGQTFYYCLVGNSQAALTNIAIQATGRVNLYRRRQP